MRLPTIPYPPTAAKTFSDFDPAGTMEQSAYCEFIFDVMKELATFTFLISDHVGRLVDRYSESCESAAYLTAVGNRSNV